MELFIFIIIGLLLILGLIGSVAPILPGPPLSFIALLLSHFFIEEMFFNTLLYIGILVLIVTFLDYWLQVYGVINAGGGKYAIRGSIIGILIGIFLLPPFGILIGAFIGAFIGAKMDDSDNKIKIAFGALIGFISGTILKLAISGYIIYIIVF